MRPFIQSREAVRVKVKKYDGKLPPDIQKFSVDPQITSLDILQSILIKAFNLKDDYSLSYKIANDGQDEYIGLFSDWDLDAAFLRIGFVSNAFLLHKYHQKNGDYYDTNNERWLPKMLIPNLEPRLAVVINCASCHNKWLIPTPVSCSFKIRAQNVQGAEPCVHLRVDIKSHNTEEYSHTNSKNYVKNTNVSLLKSHSQSASEQKTNQFGLQGIFMNQMEKTLSMVQRALNLTEDPDTSLHVPLNDAKFRSFLDPVGQVIDGVGLRQVIYCGGIDPSLRRVVWKHILNVYPEGMSGKQRMDYMKKKSLEYYSLRDVWRDCIHKGQVSNDLMYVTSMVKKDVLRTDRHHKFYAGSDDNQNIASLFNILTTYALNHPLVSYCQGMSDLASPLLVTMGDEAHAYICFCALMTRLYPNFLLDGEAMTLKFSHLTESLQIYDPQFYAYLKNQQADDLLFCYRWLLLEMKREFAFDDALRMLEVLWSSLPPAPPTEELLLKDKSFCPTQDESENPISPLVKNIRENAYTKLCAMRRQHSSASLSTVSKSKVYKRMNQSLDENIGKKCESPTSIQLSKAFQSLDDDAISKSKNPSVSNSNIFYKSKSKTVTCSSNSVSSSIEQDYDNYSELADDDSLSGTNENATNHSESKEHLLQPTSSLDKFQRDPSPVRIIENFNEFKKLSMYGCRNSCVNKNKQGISSKKCDISDTKQYENTLKESEYEDSSPDDSKEYLPMTTSITNQLKLESDNFDMVVCRQCTNNDNSNDLEDDFKCSNIDCNGYLDDKNVNLVSNKSNDSTEMFKEDKFVSKTGDNIFLWENPLHEKIQGIEDENLPLNNDNETKINDADKSKYENISDKALPGTSKSLSSSLSKDSLKTNSKFFSNMSHELENARKNCEILLNHKKSSNLQSIAVTISNFQNKYENHSNTSDNNLASSINCNIPQDTNDNINNKQSNSQLPPPHIFGGGNPFLMFLSLTLLIQHRDHIMNNRMDYNELAMHFDKMVRKHNVNRVLNQARQMYSQYLKHQNVN